MGDFMNQDGPQKQRQVAQFPKQRPVPEEQEGPDEKESPVNADCRSANGKQSDLAL